MAAERDRTGSLDTVTLFNGSASNTLFEAMGSLSTHLLTSIDTMKPKRLASAWVGWSPPRHQNGYIFSGSGI